MTPLTRLKEKWVRGTEYGMRHFVLIGDYLYETMQSLCLARPNRNRRFLGRLRAQS